MDSGFVLDYAHGAVLESRWQPGDPEQIKMLGFIAAGVKVDKENQLKVTTFRCPNCGYLESYARRKVDS